MVCVPAHFGKESEPFEASNVASATRIGWRHKFLRATHFSETRPHPSILTICFRAIPGPMRARSNIRIESGTNKFTTAARGSDG